MSTGPTTNGVVPGFTAENELERAVAADPDIQRGWAFPVHGLGHPERLVGAHVAAILLNIAPGDPQRSTLRFIALVHDSMKWAVQRDRPWSPENDHALLARRVAERHTDDPTLLLTIELHDEAFWIFTRKRDDADALDGLIARLPNVELYNRFVELDATTGGKDPTFLLWLRNELGLRNVLPDEMPQTPDRDDGEAQTIMLIEWETEPDHQTRFAAALTSEAMSPPGAEEFQREVYRSSDGARVVWLSRIQRKPDVALLRGRTLAHAFATQVDQTGARMLEARILEPVDSAPSTARHPDAVTAFAHANA
jgi:hypothetical protein